MKLTRRPSDRRTEATQAVDRRWRRSPCPRKETRRTPFQAERLALFWPRQNQGLLCSCTRRRRWSWLASEASSSWTSWDSSSGVWWIFSAGSGPGSTGFPRVSGRMAKPNCLAGGLWWSGRTFLEQGLDEEVPGSFPAVLSLASSALSHGFFLMISPCLWACKTSNWASCLTAWTCSYPSIRNLSVSLCSNALFSDWSKRLSREGGSECLAKLLGLRLRTRGQRDFVLQLTGKGKEGGAQGKGEAMEKVGWDPLEQIFLSCDA